MNTRFRVFLLFALAVFLACVPAYTQDSPSLGDLARQQRQQKEQVKATSGQDAKAPKVITNEEIPERAESVALPERGSRESGVPATNEAKQPAEHWKSQIVAQKNQVASLQGQIDELSESIRFAPANCVANCVGWNERQREKQQQVERMQAQLEDMKKRLDETQEAARKQGYGSSVYDP